MTKPDKKIDVLELMLVGGRINNERSRALPQDVYGDPLKRIRFRSEIEQDERRKARIDKRGAEFKKGKR